MAWYVAAGYELLAEIDATLYPEAASASGLLDAVCRLRDDSFEAVTLHEREHHCCGLTGYLRNSNVIVRRHCRCENLTPF
jgi:hypothetical protein